MESPFIQQIQNAANYYAPGIYRLLTQYTSFSTEIDPLSEQFLPLFTAKPNPVPFVVGLIAPDIGKVNQKFIPTPNVTPSQAWAKSGSSSAGDFQQQQFQLSELKTPTAYRGAISSSWAQSQESYSQYVRRVMEMQSMPPLKLLVNPSSFRTTMEKITSDGNWARNGPVIQIWGNGQDKIEGSGKVAAFFAHDQTGPGPGLTRTARNYSYGFRNLLSLVLLYRSNGAIWIDDIPGITSDEKPRHLAVVGSVYLFYDDILYLGSFDTFGVSEEEGSPFKVEYTFEFTVRAAYAIDKGSP